MTTSFDEKLLIIKPQDISLKVSEMAEKIILGLMKGDELSVVGVSNAVFFACSAINMATDIANAYVHELSADYIDIPIVGKFDAIFAGLGKEAKIDYQERAKEEEKDMTLTPDREGQVISVGRDSRIEKLITLCLLKFSKTDKLKLMAAGGAINEAVQLALQLTKGQISKEPIGITLIHLYSIAMQGDTQKRTAAISIYLKKGNETKYSKRHNELLGKIKSGMAKF